MGMGLHAQQPPMMPRPLDQAVWRLPDQVGALRDIKRDMAARRNSLLKQLVAEIEARVFVLVAGARGGASSSAAVDDEDPADEASSTGSLSPSGRPF